MSEYLASVNAGQLYLLVAIVLGLMTVICALFMVKSYRAGIEIGMDRKVLNKTIISSATFVGSYVGKGVHEDWLSFIVAVIAGATMGIFEYFIQKKGKSALENFSLAASMLVAMALAVVIRMVL